VKHCFSMLCEAMKIVNPFTLQNRDEEVAAQAKQLVAVMERSLWFCGQYELDHSDEDPAVAAAIRQLEEQF
jgi:hypothetical protein